MSTGLSHLGFTGHIQLSGADGPPELEWWEVWQQQIEADEVQIEWERLFEWWEWETPDPPQERDDPD